MTRISRRFLCQATAARTVETAVKSFDEIPGPKSLPLFGTLHKYLPLIGEYQFDRLHWNGLKKFRQFGPLVREEIVPGVNLVWVFTPEDIGSVFRNEGRYPERRSHLAVEKYRLDRPDVYSSGGLLPTNGPEWWRIRSELQKGLSEIRHVRLHLHHVNQIMEEFIEERIGGGALYEDFLPELSRLYLEIMCQVAFGVRLNSFSTSELRPDSISSKLIAAALSVNSCVLKTDNGPQLWRHFDTPLYQKLKTGHAFLEEQATKFVRHQLSTTSRPNETETSQTSQHSCPHMSSENNATSSDINHATSSDKNHATSSDRNHVTSVNTHYVPSSDSMDSQSHTNVETHAMVQKYLRSDKLSMKDITGMSVDFLLAGIDTSAYTTCFLLYHLATNPSVQDKLNEKVKHLTQDISSQDLDEASYAKAVIKETFRMSPISVGVGRTLGKDTVLSGYHVPAGTFTVTQNQVTCRLPQYFTNPDTFLPERWVRSESAYTPVSPYLVLPFGHGPRTCIARRNSEQNFQVLVMKLAQRYHIKWNGGELDSKSFLINSPDQPVSVEFIRRK